MPDPNDMQFHDAAEDAESIDAADRIEEQAEDEVLDIVTAKGPQDGDTLVPTGEARSFGRESPSDADDPAADAEVARAHGPDSDRQPDEADEHVDRQLDHGLKETFPASDPVSISPGAD
jgi:hypothetical protein